MKSAHATTVPLLVPLLLLLLLSDAVVGAGVSPVGAGVAPGLVVGEGVALEVIANLLRCDSIHAQEIGQTGSGSFGSSEEGFLAVRHCGPVTACVDATFIVTP